MTKVSNALSSSELRSLLPDKRVPAAGGNDCRHFSGKVWMDARNALAVLLLIGMPLAATAQSTPSCTPGTSSDWMVTTNQLAQDIRPRDCATVEQSPPDFRWPDVITSGGYSLTLTYPDGHTRTLPATQNWRNWDEILPAGSYSWTVGYAGGSNSRARKFIVDARSAPFLVPDATAIIATVSAKAHPRSLPDATTLATMKSQRSAAVTALLNDVSGHLNMALPSVGGSADNAYTYSKYALASLAACVYSNDTTYCNDAVRRISNLSSWDPNGTTAYRNAGMDMAARYLTWTVATGYDWLYPRLTSTQRTQMLATLRVRTGEMYNDIIGTRARIARMPRDSHGNLTLTVVAGISTLLAGDLAEASTWLTNALPLAVNSTNPWGDEEGGFANAATQGTWDVGELLPLWYQLRWASGIDVAGKPWVRNWGRFFTYFTPPGMAGGGTVFGDGFEQNELEHQSRYGKGYFYFSPTALGRWHASLLSAEDPTRIEYLMAPPADFSGTQAFPAGTPNSLYLPTIGQLAMHSDLANPARTSVYFKSSPPPYGAYNHSHADQNSFVVNAGGQRLAIESGYYDNYKTPHWWNWYHTTKAKNAITVDGGLGQLFYEQDNQMGYGRITSFAGTASYDVVTGDATPAYGGKLSKAQRSLVYLRPNLIVVYDNLASATSRQWEWNIHAVNQMTVTSDTQIAIQNGGQKLCVNMLASPGVRFAQTNQFSANPSGTWAAQWHGTFASTTRSANSEFVTLLNVGCTTTTASATKTNGVWTILVGDKTLTIGSTGNIAVTDPAATPTPAPAPSPTGSPAPAPEPSPTPTTTLPSTNTSAVATFESLGLTWKPPSNPGSAGCQIRYQKTGDAAWKNGLPMWYDTRNSECRGSLVQLTPGTSYVVQFSLPGQTPVAQLSASTWSEAFPIAKTVTLPNGTTAQTYAITAGGTASGYVLHTFPAGGQSTIDVANAQPYNITISAPYVIVRGLTLKGAQQDAIRLLQGAHDVVIEDNDISGWGRFRTNSSEGALGVDSDSGIHAVCSDLSLERVVIQRNRIHDPRYTTNSWSIGHPAGPQGTTFEFCGGNHVFRHNEIDGGGKYLNDGIGGADNFTTTGFPIADTDIYGNLIKRSVDDAIEAEGGNRNVRIWGNYFDQTTTGVATTVAATGPVYIFRNVYNRSRQLLGVSPDSDDRNVFAKSGSQSSTIGGGRRYLFHNTLLQATQSGLIYPLGAGGAIGNAGLTITNTVTRNNIFQIWKTNWNVIDGAVSGNDFGYDLYNGALGSATELNGIKGTPIYQAGNGWTSEAGGLYQLASSSPGYDKGALLPNFNDNFVGAGPDFGAHEAGTPAMLFGLKAGSAPAPAPTPTPTPTPTPSPSGSTPYTGTPVAIPGQFEAENFDKGGEGVAYHDTTPGNQGGQYRTGEDVDIIASADKIGGGYVINGFTTGEWLAYTINAATSGDYIVQLRTSNKYTAAQAAVHLELDGVRVTGSLLVPRTSNWNTFQWVASPAIPIAAGKHILKIVSDQQFFNLNSINVVAASATAPTPSPSPSGSTPYTGTPVAIPGQFEAENFDKGGEGVAYHDTTSGNQGGQYRTGDSVDIIVSNDALGGGYVINGFTSGEWLAYTVNVASSGRYSVQLRASNSYTSNVAFHIEVDGVAVTGSLLVPMTGGWSSFQWVASPAISLAAGTHVLKVVSDQQYFNLNSINIVAAP